MDAATMNAELRHYTNGVRSTERWHFPCHKCGKVGCEWRIIYRGPNPVSEDHNFHTDCLPEEWHQAAVVFALSNL